MKLMPYAKKLMEKTGRSVSIDVEFWVHDSGETSEKIHLFFLPGLDDTHCSREMFLSGDSFIARYEEIMTEYSDAA